MTTLMLILMLILMLNLGTVQTVDVGADLALTVISAGAGDPVVLLPALSVVAHFGRPFTETASAIPAGLAFGGIARHTGSVWYVAVIHWVGDASQDWFIVS